MSAGQTAVEVPPHVLEHLEQQHTLTLASATPGGVPRASTFLYVNDGGALYFWTKASTVTARHIEQNPVVSFVIDEYSEDLRQIRGVQGMGECSVLLSGDQIARIADLFGRKFPNLSPGTTTTISFFRITPTELQFIDNRRSGGESSAGTFGAEFHRERTFSVFNSLPTQRADSIAASLQSIDVPAGETIVRQGGPADKFFIVVEGQVEVVRDEDGQERPIASLGRGHFFGEVSIMRDLPRAATVRATEDTRLLAMERDTFRDIVAQSMETTTDFDQVIRSRLDTLGGS